MTRKNSAKRPGAVDDGRLVELAGDGRHEGPEEQDAERHAERDLDQDEAGQAS